MREYALKAIRHLGAVGECNLQLVVDPISMGSASSSECTLASCSTLASMGFANINLAADARIVYLKPFGIERGPLPLFPGVRGIERGTFAALPRWLERNRACRRAALPCWNRAGHRCRVKSPATSVHRCTSDYPLPARVD